MGYKSKKWFYFIGLSSFLVISFQNCGKLSSINSDSMSTQQTVNSESQSFNEIEGEGDSTAENRQEDSLSNVANDTNTDENSGDDELVSNNPNKPNNPQPPKDDSDKEPEKPGDDKYRVVWEPENKDLVKLSGFKGHSRVSYDDRRDALSITQFTSPNRIVEYRSRNGFWVEGTQAKMTVDMFIPNNFESIKGRLAVGIYGSNTPTPQYISGRGKNSDKVQDGFSVRVNYNQSLRPNVYAYNLNRDTTYGVGKLANNPMPTGEWFTLVLEVKMNTPGKTDGSASIATYTLSGKLIEKTNLTGMVFRNNKSWDSFGIILTEKTWGSGSINDPAPKKQSMYYRNYTMEVMK